MVNRVRTVAFAGFAALVALQATPALSAVQTWDFRDSSFNNNNNGNELGMTVDSINLTVTGWSDTGDTGGGNFTDLVQNSRLIWANSNSLGIQNRDENTSSPNHSVDSTSLDSNQGNFDMLLLEFDTAVTLDGIDLTWAYDAGNSYADISILAFDNSGTSSVSGKTWANVLGDGYQSAGNYANVRTGGASYNLIADGAAYYGVNPGNIESTAFLIGAYNPNFGSGSGLGAGNDGFKLRSVATSTDDFNPPTDVPVPGTLALFMAGLLAMRARKTPGVA